MNAVLTQQVQFTEAKRLLTEIGARYVRVGFNGEGDSGDIQDIYPCDDWDGGVLGESQDAQDMQMARFNAFAAATVQMARFDAFAAATVTSADGTKKLSELFHDWAEEIINDESFPDWCNNDGGEGEVMFDMETGEIRTECRVRVVEFESYDYAHKFSPTGEIEEDTEEPA